MSDQEGIDHLGGTVFSGGTFFFFFANYVYKVCYQRCLLLCLKNSSVVV